MKYNILILEDDIGLSKLMQKKLKRLGYEVWTSDNLNDFLLKIETDQVDLLLLDYKLPFITVEELIETLNKKNKKPPFIIITGYGDIKVAVEMMKLGATDYLIKDENFMELLPNIIKRSANEFKTHEKIKEIEQALLESEVKYKLLTDNIEDVIWSTDINLKMTYVSPSILKLLGYSQEEFLNLKLNNFIANNSLNDAERIFNKDFYDFNKCQQSHIVELEQITKDGNSVWTECKISFMYDNRKSVSGLLGITRDISYRKQSETNIEQKYLNLRKAFQASIQAMEKTTEIRDPYTAGHQRRVGNLAYKIACEMKLPQEKCEAVLLAGSIHDLGKIYIPADILGKPGKINENEFNIIKFHSEAGHDILKAIDFTWPIADIVLQHHERINGSGYPYGKFGDEILPETKIISIADVVEAMASHRAYRPALGLEKAVEEIKKNSGVLYDAQGVDACLSILNRSDFEF